MKHAIYYFPLSAIVATLLIAACVKPNPDLTPDAQLASLNGRIVNALDLVRDGALIFTNEANTGQLPLPIAKHLVQTHESALKLIEVRSEGYVQIIQTSLAEVARQLPPPLNATLAPYFSLASTLLGMLSNREINEQLSAEVIAAYKTALAYSLAKDSLWLQSHP